MSYPYQLRCADTGPAKTLEVVPCGQLLSSESNCAKTLDIKSADSEDITAVCTEHIVCNIWKNSFLS